MPTPRPHYKERIAHAEGYEIECKVSPESDWVLAPEPQWFDKYQYRVKPEPKPDIIRKVYVDLNVFSESRFSFEQSDSNLRLTFDGETGKLKAAEVI